ncbi:hypothetical protein SAMN02745945_00665 [Peptoclostridium litorale DSM 5388]|uniref:Uncharacterized protein n=1 Tax=Peptoclostridium litorale DSM 5388 TaxID=1121324 RepID=A0A069RCL5_PEPLI|nr:hypothetical protein [Peptoclostridium litorale]KDR93985.1 hypothetical protein CLIT_23c02570 [Peptoclostridium litorale DSM 5388]SIN79103.1 hypothetical protein SAMN02745945_00665 [Peptoclostridium litorale DSM 5388]
MKEYIDFNRLYRRKENIGKLKKYRIFIIMMFLGVFIIASDRAACIYLEFQSDKNRQIESKYENEFYEFGEIYVSRKVYIEDFEDIKGQSRDVREYEILEEIFRKSIDFARVDKISIDSNEMAISGDCKRYGSISGFIKALEEGSELDFEVENILKASFETDEQVYSFRIKCEFEKGERGDDM